MGIHKESIEIALAEDDTGGEVRRFGCIPGTRGAFVKILRKLASKGKSLHFCFEAVPTGYELCRYIQNQRHNCTVVTPSLIPKKAGDKVKTDKRDAIALARLYRAGELTAVYVPNPEDEAMRDLCRDRQDAIELRTRAKQRLKSFLLRHDIRCPHSANWNGNQSHQLRMLSLPL